MAWVTLPVKILGKAGSVKEALTIFNKLLKRSIFFFLDIHMGGGFPLNWTVN
ncbi:hypothetical protein DJ013_00630 [Arcticibacterium luteifluviistationis]|uniref:Uncharacterized protein n=1 Tax=Arcticibacterium luteifluviistationis TaxID=1784714 RepID=A0A2Z4G6J7_9BACT|nr:hypothetical protein DJ013_00630 [Arcticibacterium luteifluviistationis]